RCGFCRTGLKNTGNSYTAYFRRLSRISRSSTTSSEGGAGGAGAASFFAMALFIALMIRKSTNATTMKSITAWRKIPMGKIVLPIVMLSSCTPPLPNTRLMMGMMMVSVRAVTILPKAPPMMTATARSTILPFMANALNSCNKLVIIGWFDVWVIGFVSGQKDESISAFRNLSLLFLYPRQLHVEAFQSVPQLHGHQVFLVPVLIGGNNIPFRLIAGLKTFLVHLSVNIPEMRFIKILFIVFPAFGRVLNALSESFQLLFMRNVQ